jgi:hypothetical protein
VVDGVDARVRHMEVADPARLDEVRRGMIVGGRPAVSGPRTSDRNIAMVSNDAAGIYKPSWACRAHPRQLRASRQGPGGLRPLPHPLPGSAAPCGHVERVDADHWRFPKDIADRGMAHDLSRGGDGLRVRTLSTLDLEQQIGSDGATWLDRELVASTRTPLIETGFGRELAGPLDRRAERLVETRHAKREADGSFRLPRNFIATRQEVERVGLEMAKARGMNFHPTKAGWHVGGTLAGSTNLAAGRYAIIETGSGSACCRGNRCSTGTSVDPSAASCTVTAGSSGTWEGSSGWGCELSDFARHCAAAVCCW